jgi:hypothetical protein
MGYVSLVSETRTRKSQDSCLDFFCLVLFRSELGGFWFLASGFWLRASGFCRGRIARASPATRQRPSDPATAFVLEVCLCWDAPRRSDSYCRPERSWKP